MRFSSKAGLRRHERKAQLLHMVSFEYKTYSCPYKSCAETPGSGIFMKTSELREHITQQHNNNDNNISNLPYWSDSSSSSQSPPPMDTLDIPYGNNSWDEWFDNALDQINSQSQLARGGDHDCLDFPAAATAQDPSQITMTSNEKLLLTQHISSLPSFDFESHELEVFNTHHSKPSAPNFPAAPTHGSLLGTLEDNRISNASNFDYSEPLDRFNFTLISPAQASLPASGLSMATDLMLDPIPGLLVRERTLPMTQFGETDLLSTSPINALGTDPGAILNNTVPSSHQQPVKRLRSLAHPPGDFSTVDPAYGIQGHVEMPRNARNKGPIQDRRTSGKMGTQEESISMAGDVYGVSDPESNLPKKRRRGGLHGSRTSSNENQSVSQSFFDIELSQETSIEPLSRNEPREAPDFRCPRCRRTYKTEEKLS